MKVTLTVSTWNFKHIAGEYASPRRVIEQIYALGFAPELWLNWDPQPDFFDRPGWDELRELVKPSAALSFHTRNDRERMFEEVELLAHLGGRVLVVHPLVLSRPEFRDEKPATHPDLPFIRELASAARQRGVFLGLENIHARAFLDRTLEAVETFGPAGGLGICIDVGHAEMQRRRPGESAVQLIRDYAAALLHLHVHDVVNGQDHKPLGAGCIDYAAVAAALREVNFEGTAALEIQSEDPVATAEAGSKYLEKYFGSELSRRA